MLRSIRTYHYWLKCRPTVCFLVMVLCFLAFGALTLDLVQLLTANANLIIDHGILALREGGLWQLLEILSTAFIAMLAYIEFKSCEYMLVSVMAPLPVKEKAPADSAPADKPPEPDPAAHAEEAKRRDSDEKI